VKVGAEIAAVVVALGTLMGAMGTLMISRARANALERRRRRANGEDDDIRGRLDSVEDEVRRLWDAIRKVRR
jgi:hypothetical protein